MALSLNFKENHFARIIKLISSYELQIEMLKYQLASQKDLILE